MRFLLLFLLFITIGLKTTSCQKSKETLIKEDKETIVNQNNKTTIKEDKETTANQKIGDMNGKHSQHFASSGLRTNTDKISIPLEEILKGGPAKDGIPALTNPKFIASSEEGKLNKKDDGILLQNGGESKFYPYTILVWHEIVNDLIGGVPVTITFCPLCGSAIVFESTLNDTVYEFGVSGRLWQSNMLMYDRTTESLWSQIEGRSVVGDLLGSELKIFPSQLVSYEEALAIAPSLEVLSEDTGFQRNYGVFPYGDYEKTEQLYFPINNPDKKLPGKDLMVASTVKGEAVVFHRARLLSQKVATLDTASGVITAKVSENNEIILTDASGQEYPSYITMWFSWANHNEGLVWTGK